jgi:hypothetical protein
MPQLLIDTAAESPLVQRVSAHMLMMFAAMAEGYEPTEELLEQMAAGSRQFPKAPAGPKHPTLPPIGPAIKVPAEPMPLPEDAPPPPPPVEHPEYHPEGQPPTVVDPVPTEAPTRPHPTPPPSDVPAGTIADFPPPPPPPVLGVTVPAAPPVGALAAGMSASTPAANASPANTSPAAAVERDAHGFPWDKRVHSETRKKNADGTWRFRRNLDPAVKDSVMAELNATYGHEGRAPVQHTVLLPPTSAGVQPAVGAAAGGLPVPAAPAAVPQPPAAADTVPVPPSPAAGDVPAPPVTATVLPFPGQAVPVQPEAAARVPDAPQPPVVQTPVSSFRDLMTKVNRAIQAGRMSQTQLMEACKAVLGTDQVTALAAQPGKVGEVDQYISRWVA